MSRARPVLRKKCQRCQVAAQVGGCLFGCNKKERLTREMKLLIAETESRTDPLMELLRQCPQAFNAGHAVSQMLDLRHRKSGSRVLLPSSTSPTTVRMRRERNA